ncbi:alpha/beta hydrolase [SAR202 cluster bacterium AC-647-N09_OGT_505m]|nr:alpha/beta hydrolase [SAR202 cluster bacterium AC-647-N09_OGT_505m]
MTAVGQDFYIELEGLTFHLLDYRGNGRDLLLLHGLASNARFWELAAPYLAKEFRVLALDQRGHGASSKPDNGYDFQTVSADVASIVNALGLERPILVGHSWGGNVGMQVAADYPGLLAGLVCIDGGTIEPSAAIGATWEETEKALAPPDFAAMHLDWDVFLERAKTRGRGALWGDHLEMFYRANFEVQPDGTVLPRLRRELHLLIVRALWEQGVSNLYSKITCPVLIMPARRDEETFPSPGDKATKEAQVEYALKGLTNARLIWMEDSIHDVPIQRPAEVAQAIRTAEKEGFFATPEA